MAERLTRSELLALYKSGFEAVAQALFGIADDEWDRREAPEEWTTREIVHHLGESEMNAAVGFRLLASGARPTIMDYNPNEWILLRDSRERATESSLLAFRYARESTLPLLETFSDHQWQMTGTYSDGSEISTEILLEWYGPHAHDHADQIRRARKGSY